jgi:UDP-glucose 4-epimerase
MQCFVTGGAGFIGSHLVDFLLAKGQDVVAYDNFSTGQMRFLEDARSSPSFRLVEGDLLDAERISDAVRGADFVFHLAANADVRRGTEHPDRDLNQNTIATFNVLEAMRANGVRKIAFSSTGSVYGEPDVFPTPENAPFPVQTSLYAASKLAGEGLLQAYAEGFGFSSYIFRFVSILGERYSHGHVYDFVGSLRADPQELRILGDGRQKKSYLYVGDCVEAIWTAIHNANEKVNIFNLGQDHYCAVDDSAGWICERLGLRPKLVHTGGDRGWIGDSPFIFLDCARIRSLGWRPTASIRQGVERTVDYLAANSWLFDTRS